MAAFTFAIGMSNLTVIESGWDAMVICSEEGGSEILKCAIRSRVIAPSARPAPSLPGMRAAILYESTSLCQWASEVIRPASENLTIRNCRIVGRDPTRPANSLIADRHWLKRAIWYVVLES
jgi:hypothetical protein